MWLAIVFALFIWTCNSKQTSDYVKWYGEIKPLEEELPFGKMSLKEYPAEMGWISFYGRQLTQPLVDSLYREKPSVWQVMVLIHQSTTSDINGQETSNSQVNLKFNTQNAQLLDVQAQRGVTSCNNGYLLVFKSSTIKPDAKLLIESEDKTFHKEISLERIKIPSPKRLKV
ncbi:MAG: hypothetical protein JNL57_12035 [Bacteroidetes bacterium]|nr:hypothetical protein [Bacteroidota bacterium]